MKKYKTEFKRAVVQSFLAGEGGAKLLARWWSVPEEKIRTWVSHYRLHGIDGFTPKQRVTIAASVSTSVAQQEWGHYRCKYEKRKCSLFNDMQRQQPINRLHFRAIFARS